MIGHVMVVGYGIMGRGIAASFLRGGHRVSVLSRDPGQIGAIPKGIEVVPAFPGEPPDLVIEAIPEDMELKSSLFDRLGRAYGGKPILATNTSGLSMQEMADRLSHPERFIGIHYFQPAEMFPSVEVIQVAQTDQEVIAAVTAALKRNGQNPVLIKRPVPGFLVNRLQHALLHEAFSMLEQGLVTAEDIDLVCKSMLGPRMCVTGLIEQKDISGLATTAATQRNLVPTLNHGNIPTRAIQEMVARGEVGVASGKGFYDWSGRDIEAHRQQAMEKLGRILAILSE